MSVLQTEDVLRFRISPKEGEGELGAVFREVNQFKITDTLTLKAITHVILQQCRYGPKVLVRVCWETQKDIESESRSRILDKRQEKAMEKTITKLCLMLAIFHLVRMADAMAIGSKAHSSKQPVITYFGLHEATDIAFNGTKINLSCIMENAEVASFLKSGNPVAESERVTYFFQGSVPYPSGPSDVLAQSKDTQVLA
ncbi:hypothetical protein P5673_028105 [Acropora cervicornis]|uniref:Uncharacterized protein n=1 Tax=Acropora cervicornis TaxID=6130 RepID=A0AAD9PXM3_ACRCE|nr:hypothetical protein P5673_028105 [Acropora cervicornis]